MSYEEEEIINENSELLLSDARGIYIPRDFVESEYNLKNVSEEDIETCKNPDDEWYWDAWINICDNAILIDKNGKEWTLYQDGDLWAIPVNQEEN